MNPQASIDDSVCIVGLGGCTSIGTTMPAAAAAVRAGIALFGDHPFMIDSVGQPMVVAFASHLPEDIAGVSRLLELATPAAAEALSVLPPLPQRIQSLPVIVG